MVTFGRQDTNKCWDNCAKDPECTVAAIADQLCYTFRTTTNNPSAGLTAAEIFVMRDKIFGKNLENQLITFCVIGLDKNKKVFVKILVSQTHSSALFCIYLLIWTKIDNY